MFNRHQYPFVLIDISLARGLLWFAEVLLIISQLSRLSHKVCRLHSPPFLLLKFTNIGSVRHECLIVPLMIFQLSFSFKSDGVDVNVTPGKRQVFVQEEKVLLATIKSSLRKMFDGPTVLFDVNNKPVMQIKLSVSTFVPKYCIGDSYGNEDLRCSEINQDEKVSDLPASVVPKRANVEKGNLHHLAVSRGSFH